MDYLKEYGYTPNVEEIESAIRELEAHLSENLDRQTLLNCFSMMELTTRESNDTPSSVKAFVDKVSLLKEQWPDYPLPASVCVYPNFASVVRQNRCCEDLHVTTVASCFPSTQSFLEVKTLECTLAVREGADEVDIVLSLANFLDGRYDEAKAEIEAMRKAIDAEAALQGRKVVLKVILETGLLGCPERISRASLLAMEAGADFIKTSTGKVDVNATPMAAFVMCQAIKAYYQKTSRKVGFKAAGGISTASDAALYYSIVKTVLGQDWLNKDLFRLGVSRLGNSLMSEIEKKEVKFF